MRSRVLGKTGLRVSELGFGAWGIGGTGWVGAEDDESLRALRRAIELGVNFIDTALGYGRGRSERLVGQVAREHSGELVVGTKIPPKNGQWPARAGVHADEAFPADHVIACTEQSLRNLGLETIAVQQFHVWSDEWLGQGDWEHAIEQLKSDGKIRSFGVSINDHQPANGVGLVESGIADAVQVISQPAVSTAIAGMRTVAHVETNIGAVDAGPLPEDQLARLRGHRWVRDFYRAPAGV